MNDTSKTELDAQLDETLERYLPTGEEIFPELKDELGHELSALIAQREQAAVEALLDELAQLPDDGNRSVSVKKLNEFITAHRQDSKKGNEDE